MNHKMKTIVYFFLILMAPFISFAQWTIQNPLIPGDPVRNESNVDGIRPVCLIPVKFSLLAYSGNNTGTIYSPTSI